MNIKIIQALILCAVCLGIFFAVYLRKPVVIEKTGPQEVKAPEHKYEPWHPTFTVAVDPEKPFSVGILGESSGDETIGQTVNIDILKQLLEALKDQQAKAVFFTGNLVSGLEKIVQKDAEGGFRTATIQQLTKQLVDFKKVYQSVLGKDIPLFPVVGEREIVIPGAAKSFMDEFHLTGAAIFDDELAYTVSIGQAFFAIIATEELTPGNKKVKNTFTVPMLKWLERVLADAATDHHFLFVVGHEPAFPSSSTYTAENIGQRDAFWKILVDNGVLAYFSSREHLFDRSKRYGVWQVISGGGGAPMSQGGGTNPFYHCLLMTIPVGKDAIPKIEVYDAMGKVVDEFELKTSQDPLYQMRISGL